MRTEGGTRSCGCLRKEAWSSIARNTTKRLDFAAAEAMRAQALRDGSPIKDLAASFAVSRKTAAAILAHCTHQEEPLPRRVPSVEGGSVRVYVTAQREAEIAQELLEDAKHSQWMFLTSYAFHCANQGAEMV